MKCPNKELIESAAEDIKKGLSFRAASKKYGIPKMTLHDHIKGKFKGYETRMGPNRFFTDEEEAALSRYLLYMSDAGYPLTRKLVKLYAREILLSKGKRTVMNEERGPSNSWLDRFLKRHNEISSRTSHRLEKGYVAVPQEEFQNFYEKLHEQLAVISNDPSRIFNMDESGFGSKSSKTGEKVLCRKGQRCAYQIDVNISGHITGVFCISASGQQVPIHLVFSKNVPATDLQLPGNWTIGSTKSGFVDTDELIRWLTSFIEAIDRRRPVVLIMDQHKTHAAPRFTDMAMDNGIILVFLPAKTSLKLQPLDVGFFHLLKKNVASITTSLGYAGATIIPRHEFPRVLEAAVARIAPSAIQGAFTSTGIHPFNADKVRAFSTQVQVIEESEDEACPTCHRSTRPNILVRAGIVPPSLGDILVAPPKHKPRSRSAPARVLIPSFAPSIAASPSASPAIVASPSAPPSPSIAAPPPSPSIAAPPPSIAAPPSPAPGPSKKARTRFVPSSP